MIMNSLPKFKCVITTKHTSEDRVQERGLKPRKKPLVLTKPHAVRDVLCSRGLISGGEITGRNVQRIEEIVEVVSVNHRLNLLSPDEKVFLIEFFRNLQDEASLLLGMNDVRSDTASRQRSGSPFSFPRQKRSVRPRLYLSIDSDSE